MALWETPDNVEVRLLEGWQLLILSTQFQTSIRDAAETDSLASLPVYAVQRVAICGIRCVASKQRDNSSQTVVEYHTSMPIETLHMLVYINIWFLIAATCRLLSCLLPPKTEGKEINLSR